MGAASSTPARWSTPRVWTAVFVLLLLCYTGPYVVLSKQGRFEVPVTADGEGMKWWEWMPKGFSRRQPAPNGGRLRAVFAPLWLLDNRLWHNERRVRQPGYRMLLLDGDGPRMDWREFTP